MAETTTIEIDKETRTRLKVWKAERDLTYDEAINELINREEDSKAQSEQ